MKNRAAFTLVELLVVIAIIGILVSLLLPAVQAAREAARRNQCKNHLKQLSLGCLEYENAFGFLPSAGWTQGFTADANMGVGASQPGSWFYQILPYLEEQSLRNLGAGKAIASAAFRAESTKLHQSVVSIFHCPSRREARLYPQAWTSGSTMKEQDWVRTLPLITKADYAANSGDSMKHAGVGFGSTPDYFSAPASYSAMGTGYNGWTDASCKPVSRGNPQNPFCQTGVIHYRSEIKIAQIPDGSAGTYLLGEKHLSPEIYETAEATRKGYGDNQGAWIGFEWDNHRVAWNSGSSEDQLSYQPRQDTMGVENPNIYAFGSAHAAAMNMAMCDGSVHSISYDVERDVHRALANRMDGSVANLIGL